MARKDRNAVPIETAEEGPPTAPAVAETSTSGPAEETAAPPALAAKNDLKEGFPDVIKTAVFKTEDGGDYKVRLLQVRASNEMRIQFGEGRPQDKPADAVLDLIRSRTVPEELKTARERQEGRGPRLFRFKEGGWSMWMRTKPHVARQTAEAVFDEVVGRLAQMREPGRDR